MSKYYCNLYWHNVLLLIHLNDYLYILSDQKVVVVNENDWERVNSLSF